MLNAAQAIEAAQAIHFPSSKEFNTKEEFMAARAAYRAAQDDVTNEFRAYLEDAYAWSHPSEALQNLWDAAWGNGHASGYNNVEAHYIDYADLSEDELEELNY